MRDPKRIDRILAQIEKAWLAFPDMRIGQLMLNISRSDDTSSLWNLEDDAFEQMLDKFTNQKIESHGLRHVKRRWNETRGDRNDDYGASWWYFEIDPTCHVVRQVEQYDDGPVLGYNSRKSTDEHGRLSTEPLEAALLGFEFINDVEFNRLWKLCSNH